MTNTLELSLREAAAEILRLEKRLGDECRRRRLAEVENKQLKIDLGNYRRWWQELEDARGSLGVKGGDGTIGAVARQAQ